MTRQLSTDTLIATARLLMAESRRQDAEIALLDVQWDNFKAKGRRASRKASATLEAAIAIEKALG